MVLEVCVNSAVSAIEAWKGGANRVELCDNLQEGGTTPSAGSIHYAREKIPVELFVMIRPRGGDFLYSDAEFEIMKHDIAIAKKLEADGVVFGILSTDGKIDKQRMETLIQIARPMGITFHRAFDMTLDPFHALEDLISLGVDRILTSGQKQTALEGSSLIRELIEKSYGRIIIMPGSGIKEHNIRELIKKTSAKEIHIHLDKQEPSGMEFRRPGVSMGKPQLPEFENTITDQERIRKIRNLL